MEMSSVAEGKRSLKLIVRTEDNTNVSSKTCFQAYGKKKKKAKFFLLGVCVCVLGALLSVATVLQI